MPYMSLTAKGNYKYGDYDACEDRYQYGLVKANIPELGPIGFI